MIKRVHIKGFKSLVDTEVELRPLSVLFGPNASGKSNFLDALQLLSRIVRSNTIAEAFESGPRGRPLEMFSYGEMNLEQLRHQERVEFRIEVDFSLSQSIAETVTQEIDFHGDEDKRLGRALFDHPDLRYSIQIEMSPSSGALRVADEYLKAIDAEGQEIAKYLWIGDPEHVPCYAARRDGGKLTQHWAKGWDGQASALTSVQSRPKRHPCILAAQRQLSDWRFYCFEPHEQMRTSRPLMEMHEVGSSGIDLYRFLHTLQATEPKRFESVKRTVRMLIPSIEDIIPKVSEVGDVELYVKENGREISARLISDGTLRFLGLISLFVAKDPPTLVGIEEPENGVHPRRLGLIGRILETQEMAGRTQVIVTTHSPTLLDAVPLESLFVTRCTNGRTTIHPLAKWAREGKRIDLDKLLNDAEDPMLISDLVLRGDLDG